MRRPKKKERFSSQTCITKKLVLFPEKNGEKREKNNSFMTNCSDGTGKN